MRWEAEKEVYGIHSVLLCLTSFCLHSACLAGLSSPYGALPSKRGLFWGCTHTHTYTPCGQCRRRGTRTGRGRKSQTLPMMKRMGGIRWRNSLGSTKRKVSEWPLVLYFIFISTLLCGDECNPEQILYSPRALEQHPMCDIGGWGAFSRRVPRPPLRYLHSFSSFFQTCEGSKKDRTAGRQTDRQRERETRGGVRRQVIHSCKEEREVKRGGRGGGGVQWASKSFHGSWVLGCSFPSSSPPLLFLIEGDFFGVLMARLSIYLAGFSAPFLCWQFVPTFCLPYVKNWLHFNTYYGTLLVDEHLRALGKHQKEFARLRLRMCLERKNKRLWS